MSGQPITFAGLVEMALARPKGRRFLLALVGAPGSGKSHIAEALCAAVTAQAPGRAAVLPMDGFHYDDAVLHALDRHPRKGAPDTFDVDGLRHLLERLRRNDENAVAVPVFDRDLEISRAAARLIPQTVDLVIVEGNYLLLQTPPWSRLAPFFDQSVFLDVPEAELALRLRRRWEGYQLTEEQIRVKLDEVDLPNGRRVAAESRSADFILQNVVPGALG
ncbi:nucleoside/nucleotide kinase family protein [Thioclava sp. BHET1]|nr:nucleoside/nucleotide kinase family protein [Thioclava sp. BHET1]